MEYLFYTKETDTRARVELIYSQEPPESLTSVKSYIEVSTLPEEELKLGKHGVLYCNPEDKSVWYEYVDRPLTDKEELDQLKESHGDLLMEMAMLKMGGLS